MLDQSDPFTMALVIDTSRSMWPLFADLRVAAWAFLEALRPGDRALVATFDDRAWLVQDLTGDTGVLGGALVRLRPFASLSRLYDALDVVFAERMEKVAGRTAVVVLSDGMDVDSYRATASSVMARLESANVPVYAVQFDTRGNAPRREPFFGKLLVVPDGFFDTSASFDRAAAYLAELARQTGGLFEPAATAHRLRRVADQMRGQYVLYYHPSREPDGTFRRIRVESSRPGVIVRAPAGSRAPARRR
jgi:VWFA-related protein